MRDALFVLVPFVELKNMENTLGGVLVLITKSNTPPLFFPHFVNCLNVTIAHKASHMKCLRCFFFRQFLLFLQIDNNNHLLS